MNDQRRARSRAETVLAVLLALGASLTLLVIGWVIGRMGMPGCG